MTEATKTQPAAAAPVQPAPEMPYGTRLYEAMWLVDATAARENMTQVMDGLKELVQKSGGTWINGDRWDERRLAYPIKKKKRGCYIITHFSSPTENITRLERNINISDLVLRALIVKDEDGLTTVPVIREDDRFGDDRGPRDDRPPRGGGRFDRGDRGDRDRDRGDRGGRGDDDRPRRGRDS